MLISIYTLILGIWKAIIKSSVMSGLSHKHYSAAIMPDSWGTSGSKIVHLSVSSIPCYCERSRIRRYCWDTS